MTYTRASSGTCTKTATGGLVTTGIANGDLVACSTNQPRVEYDGAGYLGLLVEAARTNYCLRSQEFDNAVWVPYRDGVPSIPVVTANAATAPDGTMTADRVDFGATTAAQSSILYQSGVLSAAAWSGSVYIKGVSGSGTLDVCLGTTSCGTCTFVSGSWSRCVRSATASGTLSYFYGNASLYNGGVARSAASVYLWGGSAELGSYVTSYIPTTSAAVTRAAATASLSFSAFSGGGSVAGSLYTPSSLVANGANLMVAPAINGTPSMLAYFNSAATCYTPTRVPTAINQGGFVSGSRISCWLDATTSGILVDGVGSNSNSGTWPSAGVVQIGVNSTAPVSMNGIHSRICVDPSITRCR